MKDLMLKRTRQLYMVKIIMALLIVATTGSAAGKDRIRIKDGKISVAIKESTLLEVMSEVQRQTSLTVKFYDPAAKVKRISAAFDQLDLEEGLRRILRENYVLYFVKDPRKGFLVSEIKIGTKSFQTNGLLHENILSYGSGPNNIGLIDEGEGAQAGPASFCTDKDGTLYIADTVNNKIKIFSTDGKFLDAISLKGEGPNDITLDEKGNIYVYDLGGSLYQYDRAGKVLGQIAMDESRWDTLGPMHLVDGKVFARANGVGDILLATVENGTIKTPAEDPKASPDVVTPGVLGGTTGNRYTPVLKETARGAEVNIDNPSGTSTVYIPLQDIVSVEVLGEDRFANFYVKTEANKNTGVEVEVSKFDSSGTYAGTLPIPGNDYAFWSIRTVTVNTEGIIDQIMPGQKSLIHRSFKFN